MSTKFSKHLMPSQLKSSSIGRISAASKWRKKLQAKKKQQAKE
ncbi:MAG: hypothetical protein WC975_13320 [Phycisphaerae bacterium]